MNDFDDTIYFKGISNPETFLNETLAKIPIGTVQSVLSADVVEAIDHLESSNTTYPPDWRLIVHQWSNLVESELVIKDTLRGLAKAALEIWPTWYRHLNIQFSAGETHEEVTANHLRVKDLQQLTPLIAAPWLKKAIAACQNGQIPLFRDFSRTLQLTQLALILDLENLILILAVTDETPSDYQLLGFARAATWLAQTTKARVVALIHSRFVDHPELASILYGAITLAKFSESSMPPLETSSEGYKVSLLQGKPHHNSDVEQRLCDALSKDTELSSLFSFNQIVTTKRGQTYTVDLLWQEGRIVVELDGDDHRQLYKFKDDRHRDYELLISDYLVLRLPNDVVKDDWEIALDKIRDVVRFRRNQLNSQV